MEAPIQRVIVFGMTYGTHSKHRHGCARPIIRNVARNGESRAAIRAVNEGITISAVRRIEQFLQALVTGGNVGGNQGTNRFALVRRDDAEFPFTIARDVVNGEICDVSQGWWLRSHA